jgi:glycosidase
LTITTDAALEAAGTLALKRTITITLSGGNDAITAAPVAITGGSAALSYTYPDFTDGVLEVPVSSITTSAGISITVNASVTNSQGTTAAAADYTTVENPDETVPAIQANKATGITSESSISGISFTVTDNNSAATTAYYTTDGTTPTTSSTVYASGDASAGLTGPQFTITETTRYKFLVVDAAGNETVKSFYYIFSSGSTEDFRDETIYFVITTRFYDGDSSNNRYCWDGPAANKTNGDPEWRGDFKGLTEKLDYIKALGFSAIWITPPVENAGGYDYHGYHAFDFSRIDDRYATSTETAEQSYQEFIDAAHAKGLKVIQDIVLNHTGNWGETNLFPMFSKGKDNGTTSPSMVELTADNDTKVAALEGGADMISSGTSYSNLTGSGQYSARINAMKEDSLDTGNIYHHEKSLSWSGYTVQTGQIAGDCVDLNTENPAVEQYLINCYDRYIDMGVDAFRIDTCKHISRLMFNTYFNNAFKTEGGAGFYMFGEVCVRYWGEWNEGIPAMSPCFYTWKDTTGYATGTLALNSAAAKQNWTDYSSSFTPPVSASNANYLLINNTYRTPDYTYQSGLNVIDFPMHWAYNSASSAFGVATSYDKDYCDPTWNVTYVDSHDYAPDGAPESERFAGYWPDKLDLLFTFRGIPCLYYGSEIEFQKGKVIDAGTTTALADTGRAYYGDYLEGTVTAGDFGEYTASGTVATTLNGELARHIIRLNKIRRSIAALRKGQYSTENCSGSIAFKRRYTDDVVDSFALVAIDVQAVFSGLPAGTYIEVVTGKTATVPEGGSITTDNISTGNMRVYVLETSACEVSGKIGTDGTYLH